MKKVNINKEYMKVLYMKAAETWSVHTKKQISDAMTEEFLNNFHDEKFSVYEENQLKEFISKMMGLGFIQQELKKDGIIWNDNQASNKYYPAGNASACSHPKSGKVEWMTFDPR